MRGICLKLSSDQTDRILVSWEKKKKKKETITEFMSVSLNE